MACSYHERNLIPKDLSSVVHVLAFPPLGSSEQLGGLSAADPKLILLPKRMTRHPGAMRMTASRLVQMDERGWCKEQRAGMLRCTAKSLSNFMTTTE